MMKNFYKKPLLTIDLFLSTFSLSIDVLIYHY